MEVLLRQQLNWMDLPENEIRVEWLKANDPDGHFNIKFDAREQIGDIVDFREDGYWSDPATGKGWSRDKFYLVLVPGEEIPDINCRALYNQQGNLKKARRYNIDTTLISWIDSQATLCSSIWAGISNKT